MGLKKLIKNRISSEWKNAFNHNVEQIERAQKENQTSHKATNKRIDNLVLASGGDSPNEVTDARTNNQGDIFDTLKARIDDGESLTSKELKDMSETLTNQREEIAQLNGVIQELYSGEGSNINLYVHADRGNDTTANGSEDKPFKTIQGAVNGIPFISSANYYINVAPGAYLEDVVLNNINANKIEIKGTNNNAVDALEERTGVHVRSLRFNRCKSTIVVKGITQTDVANSSGYFIFISGGSYTLIDNCNITINTKDLNTSDSTFGTYRGVSIQYGIMNLEHCRVSNQARSFVSSYGSTMRVSNDVYGVSNESVYCSYGSFILTGSETNIQGKNKKITTYGGQVFGL